MEAGYEEDTCDNRMYSDVRGRRLATTSDKTTAILSNTPKIIDTYPLTRYNPIFDTYNTK
jgi:hypothetical protein